jgi:sialic acid synthase SpsE
LTGVVPAGTAPEVHRGKREYTFGAPELHISNRPVGLNHPAYFIADIGSNHDGNLDRACELIHLAAKAGADAVKFQYFRADHIVSEEGFNSMPKMAHQAGWEDSVVETYRKAEVPWSWTPTLVNACKVEGVEFMATPYDLEVVGHLSPWVNVWKVGSGDITYTSLLCMVGGNGRPVILSTGASTIAEVAGAMALLRNVPVVLMQCNTNYTGDIGNVKHSNLNVLKTYNGKYPRAVLGLSDHTSSLAVILGAVALGARVIERHFTSTPNAKGPDHSFAITASEWSVMVLTVRELEDALGSSVKDVCENEKEARVVQRRATWFGKALRPCFPHTEKDG